MKHYISYKRPLPDPRFDHIRSAKQTDRGEKILNTVMIIVAVICLGILAFFYVRREVEADKACMSMTQEQWDSIGYYGGAE